MASLQDSSKHAEIEGEGLWFFDAELAKIAVRGIQQNVPLSANGRGRNMQRNRLPGVNPAITNISQRIVAQLVPFAGQGTRVKPVGGEAFGNFRLDGNKVIGPQIRLEMNKRFERRQREGRGSIDNSDALAIPSATEEPGAITRKS